MISGKGIKVLCYIAMSFVFLVAVILLVFGVYGLTNKDWFSIIWIVLGLLLPLVVSVSLYPIFALASIDENIQLLNQRVKQIGTTLNIDNVELDFDRKKQKGNPEIKQIKKDMVVKKKDKAEKLNKIIEAKGIENMGFWQKVVESIKYIKLP